MWLFTCDDDKWLLLCGTVLRAEADIKLPATVKSRLVLLL